MLWSLNRVLKATVRGARLSRLTDIRARRHQAEPTSTRTADNIFIRSGYAPQGAHESLIWNVMCSPEAHRQHVATEFHR